MGGNFNKVINGIKTLVSIKKELNSKFPIIHIQFLVFSHNENQIKEIKTLSKQLGVNKLKLKSAQIENFEDNSNLIPSLNKFSRYTQEKQAQIKTNLQNSCFRIWSTAVVNWEGKLIPCCFDKNLQFTFGDTNFNDLKKLWTSSKFNSFRKEILQNRKKNAICRNCSEGLRIKY